jgi:hypothetical protein
MGALVLASDVRDAGAAVPHVSVPHPADAVPSAASIDAPRLMTTYDGGSAVLEAPLYSSTLDVHTSYRIMLPPGYGASTRR